jgi:hypothetical protein
MFTVTCHCNPFVILVLSFLRRPRAPSFTARIVLLRIPAQLSWKCRRFRCRPQLVLTTWCRVFPTCRPDTADVSATSCDVGFFFSVSYVVSLPNCRHVVVVCSLITYTINHSRYIQNSGTQERETKDSQRSSCSSSVWRHLSCSPFCHVLSGATQKMHPRTTQNTTTQHTTINMSRSRPTLQRLCPLSLHG